MNTAEEAAHKTFERISRLTDKLEDENKRLRAALQEISDLEPIYPNGKPRPVVVAQDIADRALSR